MSNRVIKMGCGYGEKITIFSLRRISLAEENKFTASFAEIPKTDDAEQKAQAEYNILVDAIASWITDPIRDKQADGGETNLYAEEVSASDGVREFFKERNVETERIANSLVLNFRSKLQPDVVFY